MATAAIPTTNPRTDNYFFVGMAILIIGIIFAGFARTYYLAGMLRAPLPNALVHVHGAVFTCWVLLFITQTSLVAAGRVDIHRKLGLFGFGLASLMVILGVLAATDSLARHYQPGAAGIPEQSFYAIPLFDMLCFATLIFFAFRERFHPAVHKRLILLGTIGIMDAGFARWVRADWWDIHIAHYCVYALIAIVMGYDFYSTGKVQRVTLWASALIVVIYQAELLISPTAPWISFAASVQAFALAHR
jgi:hypothetical protein